MAVGDEAAAAGMDLVPSTGAAGSAGKVRQGWQELNRTRDYIAQFFTSAKAYADAKFAAVSLTWASITGKPSTFPPSAHLHSSLDYGDGNRFGSGVVAGVVGWDTSQNVGVGGQLVVAGNTSVGGAFINPHARSNGVSGWLALGVNAGGQIGFQLSSRRFKKDIKAWAPDKQAILAMRLVEFHYKVAYDDGNGEIDHGLIAEELHDLGLTWLVAYDTDGEPVTVKYDRIGLALLPIVQDHEARLQALEER